MVVRPRSVSHGVLDDGHLNPAGEEVAAGERDLSHHGDPGDDEEVIVIEEPEKEDKAPARQNPAQSRCSSGNRRL